MRTILVQMFYSFAFLFVSNTGYCTPKNFQYYFFSACSSKHFHLQKCQGMFNSFTGAFRGRDPVTIKADDYDDYIDLDPPNPGSLNNIAEHVMFYTGTRMVAASFPPNAGIYTSNSIVAVDIINRIKPKYHKDDVHWCGRNWIYNYQNDGFEYDKIVDCSKTKAYKNFWAAISIRLARSVQSDTVFWLAYGNHKNGAAYDPTSDFAKYEIPSLPQAVNKVVVILLCALDDNNNVLGQTCNDVIGQGADLRTALENKDIQDISCYNLRIKSAHLWKESKAEKIAEKVAQLKAAIISQGQQNLDNLQGNSCNWWPGNNR